MSHPRTEAPFDCESYGQIADRLGKCLQRIGLERIAKPINGSTQVRAASFRTIRGLTSIAAIAEECSFWQSDESNNPDSEILAAVRPSLATTGGPLIAIGSPHARRGEAWNTYRKHFGASGNKAILVANGETTVFNPTIRQSVIDRAYEEDPAVAASEWGGQFRSDLESYVSPEIVDACTARSMFQRAFEPRIQYVSHCDPSGGSQDLFCLVIGHVEDGRGVLDALIEHRPPFSPESVIADLAEILAGYHLNATTDDRYASGFNAELFRKFGIEYRYSNMTTSDFFGSFLPILNSRRTLLLDNKRLQAQLCSLERRASRIGAKDSISHPPGGHDDLAAAVAGLMVRMIGVRDYAPKTFVPPFISTRPWGTGPELPPVIADPGQFQDPLCARGSEYGLGSAFDHLLWTGRK